MIRRHNRNCVEVGIEPCPPTYDLGIRKQAVGGFWKVGTTRQFLVRVGVAQGTFDPSTASVPTFVDLLPAGAAFASASGTGWTCSAVGPQVSCTYQGASAVAAPALLPPVTIAVHLTGPAAPIRNCAEAGPDLVLTNNRACIQMDVGK
jgi:hypothetical protein